MRDSDRSAVIAVDLGKTSCRVRLEVDDLCLEEDGPGAPGLADSRGTALALDAIRSLVVRFPDTTLGRVGRAGVGAAGAEASQASAGKLAHCLSKLLDASVAVASDVAVAHIGALGGGPGTVLIVGTGSVARGLDTRGVITRADGWGPLLGDEGSGRWIGQAGLQRALRALDRRGPETSLTAAATKLAGSAENLPAHVHGSPDPGRLLAAFAPIVLAHAEAGDAVAREIVTDAVRFLTDTARAAADPRQPLCVVGGLMRSPRFARELMQSLRARGLATQPPQGNALAGASLIAKTTELPHERYAVRVAASR